MDRVTEIDDFCHITCTVICMSVSGDCSCTEFVVTSDFSHVKCTCICIHSGDCSCTELVVTCDFSHVNFVLVFAFR